MRVTWGLEGTSTLPSTVTDFQIITCVNAGQEDENCDNTTTCSVNAITLMADAPVTGCRPGSGTEMYGSEPVLVRSGLPMDTPIRFELIGKGNGEPLFVGRTGAFVLGEGERRFVDLHMYALNRPEVIAGTHAPRFLHTSTLLPDGRVLIAGGFTSATRMMSCPDSLGLPAETRCFDLVATDEAIAFDPATGRATTLRNAMLAARGGHSATVLPDGRVLLAGGAPKAVLAMVPQGMAAAGGFRVAFYPQLDDGSDGALDTFELFDAYLDEQVSTSRDGDPGRGRFIGVAGHATPGPLNHQRFLHAATALPSAPDRVLLAGGMGDADTAATWEIFDNQRAGGYGVYAESDNRLPTARKMPSAIGVGDHAWIFGGALAHDDSELADVWDPSDSDPNGTVSAATMARSEFPNSSSGAGETHPEYALMRPGLALVEDGSKPLVVGWYGPQCEPGMSAPEFVSASSQYCTSPGTADTRSFTVSDDSGIATATTVKSRSFGAVTTLGCFRPGGGTQYTAMTGGIANAIWTPQAGIDVFTGTVDGTGAAERALDINVSLSSPRFFHASTGLPGLGIVTSGGITFSASLDQVIFQAPVEVVFLPSPDYDHC